jgi:sporulation protein YlmC with PRC-barrel domain
MITNYSEVYKAWVFAKNPLPDIPVGQLVDFVINPDSGKFEAIWIKSVDGLRLISPKDVISWESGNITIMDENELTKVENFPKIQKTLTREVAILNAKVFVKKTKQYLGRVKNFSFDTVSPQILSLTVRSRWGWLGKTRIVTHKRIIEISAEGVFVQENFGKVIPRKIPLRRNKAQSIPELDAEKMEARNKKK